MRWVPPSLQQSVAVAVALVFGMAVSFLAGALVLAFGGALSPWQGWLGVVIAGGMLMSLHGSLQQTIGRTAIGATIVAVSMAVSAATFDFGWDGQYAHQANILFLGHGWNPLSPADGDPGQLFQPEYPALAGAGPYLLAPRTTHLLGALLFMMTGQVETAKAINLLAAACAGVLAYAAFRRWHFTTGRALTLAALVVLNPAAVPLYLTTSVDAFLWALTASMVALAMLLARSPSSALLWVGWVAAFVLLASSKLTGAGFAIFIGGGALILGLFVRGTATWGPVAQWSGRLRGRLRPRTWLLAGLLVAVLALGLQFAPRFGLSEGATGMPYSLSELRKALFEERSTGQILWIEGYPRPVRFLVSLMSRTDSGPAGPPWKIPFFVYPKEIGLFLRLYEAPETGGFGPWAGGCFLLLLAGNLILILQCWHRARFFLLLQCVVLACNLPLPNAIARFVIPLWLLWILAAAGFWFCSGKSFGRWFANGFACLLVVNVMLVAGPYLFGQVKVQAAYHDQLAALRRLPTPIRVDFGMYTPLEWRLRKAGIDTVQAVASLAPPGDRILLLRTNPAELPAQILLSSPPSPAEKEILSEMQRLQANLRRFGIILHPWSRAEKAPSTRE